MHSLKYYALLGSLSLVKLALRLYGWRNGPRPAGYPASRDRQYWRPKSDAQIESATFAEAINSTIQEARKSK